MKKILYSGIFLLLILSSFFCNNNTKKNNLIKNTDSKEFLKNIPKNKRGDFLVNPLFIEEVNRKLNIFSINKGFDSLCVRLWYYTTLEKSQMFEFSFKNNIWVGKSYILLYPHNDSSQITYSVEYKEPLNGWNNFNNILFNNNFYNLPDDYFIPKYNRAIHGAYIIVEISTKKYYRVYSYNEPKMNSNFEEAKSIENVMETIEKEFEVKRIKIF